jgi:hypothetical protein
LVFLGFLLTISHFDWFPKKLNFLKSPQNKVSMFKCNASPLAHIYIYIYIYMRGESMNRGTIWIVSLVIILDYIQMKNVDSKNVKVVSK